MVDETENEHWKLLSEQMCSHAARNGGHSKQSSRVERCQSTNMKMYAKTIA